MRTLLLDDRSRIYVHIDAKVEDLGWLAHRAEPRLTVLDNRIIVNWGGYSVVKATLLLLDYAFRDDQNLRFVLLSGACFPIQPPQAVNDNILAQQTPVVSIWGKIDASLKANEGFGRYTVTKYHPLDVRGVNPKRGRALERIWNLYKRINALLPYERKIQLEDLWKGSQFFLADRELVKYYLMPHPPLAQALQHALAPDEIFFATLYVRWCKCKGLVTPLVPVSETHQGVHYVRKQVSRDRTLYQKLFKSIDLRKLDVTNIGELLASKALFARKCPASLSRRIIQSWRTDLT